MGLFADFIADLLTQQIRKSMNNKRKAKAKEREAQQKAQIAAGIRKQAREQAGQYLKIVHDCADLVNSTTNPDVFFPRYKLLLDNLGKMAGLECTGIFDGSNKLPSDDFLRIEAQFSEATNAFIDRSFAAAKSKADNLKTEKGKQNAMNRYFDNMKTYVEDMTGESVAHLYELEKTHFEGETQCTQSKMLTK